MAYSTHGNIRPLRNNVLVYDMEQGERITTGGLILLDDNGKTQGIRPRRCRVLSVGENIVDVKPGDTLLVAHGRWTRGINITDSTGTRMVHMVDTNDILLVMDE